MPVFEYKGVSSGGRSVAGILDGENLKAARAKLKRDGVVVLEIREGGPARIAASRDLRFGRRRVSSADMANTTRQLATLLSAGLPLLEALNVLVDQEEGQVLKGTLASVRDAVREGSSLTDALRGHAPVFSQLYGNMVAAGEASGTLEVALERLADFLEEQTRFRGRFAAALAYPALMTVIGVGVLFFLFSFVLPRVVGMFEDMRQQLPFITLALLAVVRFFSLFWWLIIAAAGGGAWYLRRWFRTPGGKATFDAWVLKLPVFGSLVRMVAVSRFTRTLGTLLESGVPTLTALEIVQNVIGNTVLAEAVRQARENVREGESIADPLRRSGLFPPVVVQMVAVGEKSGELEKMLLKVSDSFDRSVEARMTALMSLLEPAIILVMGLVIGFIVIAILLPIFEMNQLIK